jgi:hypothetical protein
MRAFIVKDHRPAASGRDPINRMPRWRALTAAIACGVACAGVAACASAAPYNPDHLGSAQVARIAGICQFVMGLQPSERPVWGTHADTNVALGTSHFQGCVTSLSDSLQQVGTADAAAQADQDCRAKGFAPNSPDLAVCVLQALNTGSSVAAATRTPSSPPAQTTATPARMVAVGSFFYASPRETVRREQLACAQLGLEPPGALFASCVQGLQQTFFTIDNPVE